MIKLVIFDLDGTLLYTINDLANSVNYALEKCGFPTHSVDDYKTKIGNGFYKLIERALPEGNRSEDTIMQVKEIFAAYYALHGTDETYPYSGIEELLSKLSANNIRIGVASNKYHQATLEITAHFFPNIHFVKVIGHRDGMEPKPNPAIVNEIIETAGVQKDEVLYVGDSGVDMQTAQNAGVRSVGVAWGLRTVEELTNHHADYIVHEPMEILDIMKILC